MSYSSRISSAYNSAEEISLNDHSKIVLFSDCHRGDGSWSDAFAGNRNLYTAALESYNKAKFTYIEIGDGDELWENKNLSDIIREYRQIYKLLSDFYAGGRLYFIYGNHDIAKNDSKGKSKTYSSDNEFTLLFPEIRFHEGLILNYKGSKIFLLHGHQADYFNSKLWRLSRFLVRHLWRRLESLGVNDPTSASKNHRKKTSVELNLMKWAEANNVMLIAGHTHRTAFPSPGEKLYFNDGSCVNRDYISAIEIEDGNISIVNWSFKVKESGTVYVGRDIVTSAKLKDYF